MKNIHIISALGICHKEFAYSFDGYKKRLKDILEKEDATNYLARLKSEVKQAWLIQNRVGKRPRGKRIFVIMMKAEAKKRTLLKSRI